MAQGWSSKFGSVLHATAGTFGDLWSRWRWCHWLGPLWKLFGAGSFTAQNLFCQTNFSVGVFNPFEKYAQVKLDHFTKDRAKNQKCLQPPPRFLWLVWVVCEASRSCVVIAQSKGGLEGAIVPCELFIGQSTGAPMVQVPPWRNKGLIRPY